MPVEVISPDGAGEVSWIGDAALQSCVATVDVMNVDVDDVLASFEPPRSPHAAEDTVEHVCQGHIGPASYAKSETVAQGLVTKPNAALVQPDQLTLRGESANGTLEARDAPNQP
jgi:hypothetical protein